jgi:hypothetical protein
VGKGVPIDISNVSGTTGADEPHRHDRAFLLVSVNVLASGERLSMNKKPGANIRLLRIL